MPLLDPAKIAAREAEKLERLKNKRPYNKKSINPQINNTMSDNATTTTNTETTNSVDQKIDQTTTAKTEVANTENQNPVGSVNEPAKVANNSNYKAFTGKVIKRGYSSPDVDASLNGVDIPEANFGAPKVETAATAAEDLKKIIDQKPNQQPLHTQMQETTGFNALPPKEQTEAASLSADLILEGYDGLHTAARWFIKMPKEKLQTLEAENKIDLGVVIMPANGEQDEVNLGGLFEQINLEVDATIVVTDDFKTKMRPPLERLCAKYGLGTSDAVYVGGMFLKDAATKAVMGYGLKKTLNQVLEVYSQQHINIHEEAKKLVALEKERNEAILRSQIAAENAKAKAAEERLAAQSKTPTPSQAKTTKPRKSSLAASEEKAE